jgi:hypothetical protein
MSKPKVKRNRKAEKIQAVAPTHPSGVGVPSVPAEWVRLSGVLGGRFGPAGFRNQGAAAQM